MTLWALVLYPSIHFDAFLKDSLHSIASQTLQNFSLYLFYDGLNEGQKDKVRQICDLLKLKPSFIDEQTLGKLHPSAIRHQIIHFALENNFQHLIFSDFDEKVDSNRLELTLPMLESYDFTYCNAYITDFYYNKLHTKDLHALLKIPNIITEISPIVDKNFVGLGSLGINLKNYQNKHPKTLPHTLAYDWFLATHMILCGLKGASIQQSFTKYRQHSHTYIGIARALNEQTLKLGLEVKLNHYLHFSSHQTIFKDRLAQIQELKAYLANSRQKMQNYIKIINCRFNALEMGWWENIKTLQEIQKWI